jgi:hypothetical protein
MIRTKHLAEPSDPDDGLRALVQQLDAVGVEVRFKDLSGFKVR